MPQEFHVLRCFSCEFFQVHIVKKSNKWDCKMCGEKQSVEKVYGQGTGKDCRLHVQSLNEQRILNDSSKDVLNDADNQPEIFNQNIPKFEPSQSKWREYINEEIHESSTAEESCEYTFERPNKRKNNKNKESQLASTKKMKRDTYDEYNNEENIHKSPKMCENKSKWSSYVTGFEETDVPEEKRKDETILDNFITKNNKICAFNKNISVINPCEPKLNDNSLGKDNICKKQSKWYNFMNETEANTSDCINTDSSQVPNIFNCTDIDSLDDILDF